MRIYEKWRTFLLLFECKLLSDKTVNVKKENSLANKSVVYKGSGRINIGRGTSFGSKKCQGFFSLETYIEARNSESIIRIGNNCFFNNGFNAIAEGNSGGITIGHDCLFGSNVTIVDSDFHGIGPEDRRNPDKVKTKSVIVGNNVFVGNGAFILKGVTIGDNSVIGAGSVVAMDIPPNCVAAGNPVRVIKQIYNNNANQEE